MMAQSLLKPFILEHWESNTLKIEITIILDHYCITHLFMIFWKYLPGKVAFESGYFSTGIYVNVCSQLLTENFN